MENAIKALYMGAGMILGVLILGVFIYMFRTGASVGETYEFKKTTEQIQAFNAQFEVYEHETEQLSAGYGYSFKTKGNTISDVITCANLVMDINNKYDYDLQNTIQLKLNIGASSYYIYPLKKIQKKNYFIEGVDFWSARGSEESGVNELPENKYYHFNTFLTQYNNVRIVDIIKDEKYISRNETIYEYYFDVNAEGITYSDVTGKVNSITFEVKQTQYFDNNQYWKEY